MACANVAMLFLGEVVVRRREITTRAALGAGARRIARQLLTESLLLGVLGTAVGAAAAWAFTRAIVAVAPPIPRIEGMGIDVPVFLFAALLGTTAGLVFGTVPATVSARSSSDLSSRLAGRTQTLREQSFQRIILPGQVALTVMLLVVGGLHARSYARLHAVDPGFDAENLASVHLSLLVSRYPGGDEHPEGRPARWSVFRQVLGEVEAIPGVRSAGLTSTLPFPGKNNINLNRLSDAAADPESRPTMQCTGLRVSHGYLETLGVPLLAGRTFTEADYAAGNPVMVISESMARRYWPNTPPLGSQVRYWAGTLTVIGVVGDVRRQDLTSEVEATCYTSLAQQAEWVDDPAVLVRTERDPGPVIPELQQAIWSVDPNLPVDQASTMTSLVAASFSEARYRTLLMGVFGIMAALLAATGVFGVTARIVEKRARELGIKLALGATQGRLIGSAVEGAARTSGIGILIGLVVSLGAEGLFSGFLFGVEATDPLTHGAVAGLVLGICLCASYVPARRIMRLHPAEVLRAE